MSSYEVFEKKVILKRIAWASLIVAVAAGLGLLFARLFTRPQIPEAVELRRQAEQLMVRQEQRDDYVDPEAPPFFMFAGVTPEGDRSLALAEIALAAAHDLRQYILPITAPWQDSDLEPILEFLDQVAQADPHAAYYLQVDLNPPQSWLDRNIAEQAMVGGEVKPFCSPASPVWLNAVRETLDRLLSALARSPHHGRLIGIIPAGLHNGQWHFGQSGYDRSAANLRGFQQWLRGIYVEESALQEAWGQPTASFASARIPEQPPADDLSKMFFTLPDQQPVVDFLNFVSEATADALAALTTHIKSRAQKPLKVIVPYGYTFELAANEAGHYSLSILVGSDVDGFISPVSYSDRGTGGAGGFMGPVSTARYHQKEWLIVDDTRTGVARDAITGAVSRLRGLRPEDVYHVQHRNFSAALLHGLGLVWADPAGEGWLHDAGQWTQIAHMRDVHGQVREMWDTASEAPGEEETMATPEEPAASVDETPEDSAQELPQEDQAQESTEEEETEALLSRVAAGDADPQSDAAVENGTGEGYLAYEYTYDPDLPEVPYETGLVVVVDEVSRFFQQCDVLNQVLLNANRDTAMRAGLPTQFVLLQDVLEGKSPPAPVYLFMNVFYLPNDQRDELHYRLAREQAAAIWMYAPGYFDERSSTANVTATTGMNVVAFDAPEDAASVYTLSGNWIKQDEAIGTSMLVQPLFHIDDPEADVPLAQYKNSGKTSVAMRYDPTGWTSVFVATPFLTPALLREILDILEIPLVFRPKPINQFDTTHVADRLIAIHARQIGERELELDGLHDVQDLLDPNIGWPRRESIVIPLDTGETRLLQLKPPS